MKHLIRYASATLAFSLALVAGAAEPGYVEIGQFKPVDGCEFVEVNLGVPLLKFASAFVDKEDAEAAALIRSLKQVRVNVFGFDDATRADTTARFQKFRSELAAQGWQQTVTVQQAGDAEDVAIFVKLGADDTIEGLVVTVLDADKKQAVFVNVVGRITAEQLATVGKGLHIEPLAHLKWSHPRKGA